MSIASKLSVFGVKRIIYNNRKENQDAIRLNYEFVDFDQLLNESDFIVCAASLNKENENKFDLDAFKKMKKTCIFINIARGGLVNHQDLFEALNSRLIFSAGIL
jgi:lactate dehydrogenase-like 2-hydroxyacid dehydrogenase